MHRCQIKFWCIDAGFVEVLINDACFLALINYACLQTPEGQQLLKSLYNNVATILKVIVRLQ